MIIFDLQLLNTDARLLAPEGEAPDVRTPLRGAESNRMLVRTPVNPNVRPNVPELVAQEVAAPPPPKQLHELSEEEFWPLYNHHRTEGTAIEFLTGQMPKW